jgi:hypothetical protein
MFQQRLLVGKLYLLKLNFLLKKNAYESHLLLKWNVYKQFELKNGLNWVKTGKSVIN